MHQPSILLVEDDAFQRKAAEAYLANHDLKVTAVENGAQMRRQISRAMPDLVLLDVQLPGQDDGFSLARWLRESSTRVGIIMLTAAGDSVDKVLGLESGADDYLTKPFGIREMVARVGAILRRNERTDPPTGTTTARHVRSRDVTLDPERREAVVRGGLVELTKQEFDLLYLLAARPGIVFSRSALLTKVWSDDTCVTERTVDTVINRLRRKVERNAQNPELILTAWGVGYKFVDVK